jgi:hypothetical protein
MTASTPSNILRPEPNVPTEITLTSPQGVEVRGNYGPQMLFSLTGNRRLYVPLEVGKEIQSLTLAPGQPFILTKATRNGQRGFEWKVERKPIEPVTQPQSASNQQDSRPITQLESALKTAIHAAKEAEHYGSAIGYTVRFSEDSIRAMAITILIGHQRAA